MTLREFTQAVVDELNKCGPYQWQVEPSPHDSEAWKGNLADGTGTVGVSTPDKEDIGLDFYRAAGILTGRPDSNVKICGRYPRRKNNRPALTASAPSPLLIAFPSEPKFVVARLIEQYLPHYLSNYDEAKELCAIADQREDDRQDTVDHLRSIAQSSLVNTDGTVSWYNAECGGSFRVTTKDDIKITLEHINRDQAGQILRILFPREA